MSRTYEKDPYAILGISSTANASQIKQAYHRLARQYHPDLNKDPRAVERMQDINWANDILSDPEERTRYDFWRSSSVRTDFYARTPPSTSGATPPRSSYTYSQRKTVYSNSRVTQNTQSQGCSGVIVIWLVITLLTNVVRAVNRPTTIQQSFNPSFETNATRTARLAELLSMAETFRAAEALPTLDRTAIPPSAYRLLATPSPVASALKDEYGRRDLRSEIVPGSQVWEWIHQYFPELTTPDGLSAEVTLVIYDQLRGYQIKTRNSGEYWLYIDRIGQHVIPAHYPLTVTATPNP